MENEFDPLDSLTVAVAERRLSRGEITKAEFDAVINREQAAWEEKRTAEQS